MAPSCRVPEGSPVASRSMRPSAGSGVSRVDAGQLERARVHPGAVAVPVGQEHRTVGHDRVEHVLRGRAAREHVHRPPAAEDPRRVGMRLGVRPDARSYSSASRRRAGRTGACRARRATGCTWASWKPGTSMPPAQVDDLGARADQVADVLVGADRDDRARLAPRPRVAQLRAASTVYTAPLRKTRSAVAVRVAHVVAPPRVRLAKPPKHTRRQASATRSSSSSLQ